MILILAIYCLACLGVGRAALLLVSKKGHSFPLPTEGMFTTNFLLGQGLLANLWVLMASMSFFSPLLIKTVVFIFFIPGILLNRNLYTNARKQFAEIYGAFKIENRGWKTIVLLTITIWLAWITSLGRTPTSDGSGFYLALAKVTSASERLAPLPGYETLTSIGLQGEMHFAALMTMGSPEATQVFMWLTITAGSILLVALGMSLGLNRRGQWLAFAMVFTSSAIIELSGSGKTDLFAAAFAFAAYFWVFNIQKHNERISLAIAGMFGGLAIVAKISYVATFLPSFGLILAWKLFTQSAEEKPTSSIRSFVLIGIGAVAAVLPHMIKNQLLFENPLAPFGMEGIIDQTWYGPESTRRILLTLPFALTFGDHWAQLGNLTPLVLMFLPLMLFIPRPHRLLESPLIVISLAALAGLACWFIFFPTVFAPRYFIGTLMLLVLPTAKAAEWFASQTYFNRHMVIAAVTLIVISTGFYHSINIFLPQRTYQLLIGDPPDCTFEETRCMIEANVNPALEPGERLFANDHFRYWLRADLIQCALSTEETKTYLSLETSNQRWSYIISRGFRWVLTANTLTPLANTIRNDLEVIPDWLDVNIEDNTRFFFLQVTPLDRQHTPQFNCMQTHLPAWDVFEVPIP